MKNELMQRPQDARQTQFFTLRHLAPELAAILAASDSTSHKTNLNVFLQKI